MSSIPNRWVNLPMPYGSFGYGSVRGDYIGVDASNNDCVVPAFKLVIGGTGVDAGFVSAANPLPVVFSGASSGDGAILDGASGAIRATVKAYTNSHPLTVVLVDTNGDAYLAGGGGGGGGTQYVNGVANASPTGTLALGYDGANLRALKTSATGVLSVDGSAVTQPVSAAALPLPAGASTSALQTSGNASLASIDGKLPAALVGGRLDVNIGAAPTFTVTGPLTDAQLRASAVPVSLASLPALSAGAATIGKVDQGVGGASAWKVDGSAVTQPVSIAGSVAVTGTFWQATQPVSIAATVTTDPSDRAARLLGHVTVDNASIAVTGTFWQATQPVSSTQLPAALVGGRLDENVGAWLGSTAPTVGQKTAASSLPVVLASDQPVLAVSATTLPLPTGAATETTLQSVAAALGGGTTQYAVVTSAVTELAERNLQDTDRMLQAQNALATLQTRGRERLDLRDWGRSAHFRGVR